MVGSNSGLGHLLVNNKNMTKNVLQRRHSKKRFYLPSLNNQFNLTENEQKPVHLKIIKFCHTDCHVQAKTIKEYV